MFLRSRAPMRIDFAGGWTDLIPFASQNPGAVVNAAINLHTYITLHAEDKINGIKVYSADFDSIIEISDVRRIKYDGKTDMIKAALHRMLAPTSTALTSTVLKRGVSLIIRSTAPAGGGLGSSGAMGVAMIGILSQYMEQELSSYEIADIANEIERGVGVCCGKQDHYASVFGGINFMQFYGEEVEMSKIKLNPNIQYELEKSLVLCYTGTSHSASKILKTVVDEYFKGNKDTIGALSNLRQIAKDMRAALLSDDLQPFGKLLDLNWQNQKCLHPSITTPQIDKLFNIAYSNGAIGGKACGAGGGGCLVFYCADDREHDVRKKLEESGAKILNVSFDFDGLQIWTMGA